MHKTTRTALAVLVVGLAAAIVAVPLAGDAAKAKAEGAPAAKEWALNATIIEACSCPMFCQCYFNPKPAAHAAAPAAAGAKDPHAGHGEGHAHGAGGTHYCKFNNAFQVNKGNYGGVSLDGAKFWVAGDLGGDFSKGKMDWAVLTFDPAVTPEQREGITTILGKVYPVEWNKFSMAEDAPMTWKASKDRAEAKLNGGKTAEVVLTRYQGMTNEPIVIHNLKYWGVPRNDGFVLMPNEVEAYRAGDQPYEFKGTNGFMITIDINSKDV